MIYYFQGTIHDQPVSGSNLLCCSRNPSHTRYTILPDDFPIQNQPNAGSHLYFNAPFDYLQVSEALR